MAKLRPLLPKDKKLPAQDKEEHPKALKSALKPSSPVTIVATVKTKTKTVSPPSSRKVSIVALEDDPARYCIKDFAKHYNIVTSLKPYKPNCKYIHYSKLPKTTTKADLLATHQLPEVGHSTLGQTTRELPRSAEQGSDNPGADNSHASRQGSDNPPVAGTGSLNPGSDNPHDASPRTNGFSVSVLPQAPEALTYSLNIYSVFFGFIFSKVSACG